MNEVDIQQTIYSQSKGRGKKIEKNCQIFLSANKLPINLRQKNNWRTLFRIETLFRKYMENKRMLYSRKAFIVQINNGLGVEKFWDQFNTLYRRQKSIESILLKIFSLKRVVLHYLGM